MSDSAPVFCGEVVEVDEARFQGTQQGVKSLLNVVTHTVWELGNTNGGNERVHAKTALPLTCEKLLDINMPILNGYETLVKVKALFDKAN